MFSEPCCNPVKHHRLFDGILNAVLKSFRNLEESHEKFIRGCFEKFHKYQKIIYYISSFKTLQA